MDGGRLSRWVSGSQQFDIGRARSAAWRRRWLSHGVMADPGQWRRTRDARQGPICTVTCTFINKMGLGTVEEAVVEGRDRHGSYPGMVKADNRPDTCGAEVWSHSGRLDVAWSSSRSPFLLEFRRDRTTEELAATSKGLPRMQSAILGERLRQLLLRYREHSTRHSPGRVKEGHSQGLALCVHTISNVAQRLASTGCQAAGNSERKRGVKV